MPRTRSLQRIQVPDSDPASALNRIQDQMLSALNPVLAMTLGEYVQPPSTSAAPGSVGQWSAGTDSIGDIWIYVCIGPSQWARAALSLW
jgi:hypothetical protein